MDADYSFELISIKTYAPQFIGHNKIFLGSVSSQFPFLGAIVDKVCLTLFFTTVAVSILMRLIFGMYHNGLKYFLKRHSYLHSRAYARHYKPLKRSEKKNKLFIQKLFQPIVHETKKRTSYGISFWCAKNSKNKSEKAFILQYCYSQMRFYWMNFLGGLLGGFFGRNSLGGIICLHWNWFVCQDFGFCQDFA